MVGVKVSTRGDYAARALLSLALHGSEQPTSVKEIAERTGLPQPYLEQILLAVKGAGLVRSKRGVGGGYVLARSAGRDHPRRHPRRGRRPAHHADGRARPLRGSLHPAGGVGRRVRRDPPDPRALHPAGPRRAHARRPPRRVDQRRFRWRRRSRADAPTRARPHGEAARGHVAPAHPHHDLEPARRRRLERDVTAVTHDELADDRQTEAEVPVRATVLARLPRLPEPVEGAGALRRPTCPAPRRSPGARPSRRARAAATRTALPSGATSSALFSRLSTTCSSRPGVDARRRCAGDVGLDAHVLLGRERVPGVAATVDHFVDRDRRRGRRRLLGAREHEEPVDQA